jgi:membrane protease YdiL (CAAX protease family)
VYQRNDISIGKEGEYRLELIVSGNKLTNVEHYVKVPETFDRKYEEMRSFNNTIAQFANYGLFIFYVLGGIIVGLFVLNRERWLLWKTAIYWALFVSILTVISGLNYMPLSWLGYDTAVSPQNFIMQMLVPSLIGGIIDFILLLLSFVAAESLTRKAFPNHLQFWRLWKNNNASSYEVIGQTIGGYLLIGLDLIFVVSFYMITANYFGWWVPSSTLFSPDMIATPFPWLSAVGMSLHAGFWEECLFRAVPIAGAVLISKKYGNRTGWLVFAMILQAVIFAAAHANYPSYPSYSRLVELIIPSLFWGFIYIRFGLLPVIISHFGYDVVWFSLPLFASTSNDLFFDKLMVIGLTLIPVWVILKTWLKNRQINYIDKSELNSAFIPEKNIEKEDRDREFNKHLTINKNYKIMLYGLLVISILLIFEYRSKSNYVNLNLEVSRSEALILADEYLSNSNIILDDSWSVLSKFHSGSINAEDRFIWQVAGEEVYNDLIGSYLDNNLWNIRYVKFSGEVNDKTEEYSVLINSNGKLNQIRHKIPENRAGDSLSEDMARAIAVDCISNQFNLGVSDIEEISFEPSNLSDRKDWTFIFSDRTKILDSGDLRIEINIAGNEVVSSNRFVYIPEKWDRNDKNNMTTLGLIQMVCSFAFIFLIIYAASSSVAKWSKGSFNLRIFKKIFLFFVFLGLVDLINSYPLLVSDFSSAQPFMNQVATNLISSLLYSLILSFMLSAIFSSISKKKSIIIHHFTYIEIVSVALIVIGFTYRAFNINDIIPLWIYGMDVVNTYIPFLKSLNNAILGYFNKVVIMLFIISLMDRTKYFTNKKRGLIVILSSALFAFLFLGTYLGSNLGIDTIGAWISGSLWILMIFASLYLNQFIYNIAIVPLVVSIITGFNLLAVGNSNAYPGIFLSNVICSFIILVIGYYMYLNLLNSGERSN